MVELSDSVVIVTGGGRGIGRATCFEFARAGCKVVPVGTTRANVEEVAAAINGNGGRALPVAGDVTSQRDVQAMVRAVLDQYGRIDVLVNNAGVGIYRPVLEMSEEDWERIMDVNVKGVFLCTRAVLPHMISARRGAIVNVASGAGRSGFANLSAYCASKFAVIGFTESIAQETAGTGVSVYAVCPGGTDTAMYHGLFGPAEPSRLLSPEKVARRIVELAGPHPPVSPGQCLEVYQ